ncbi:glycosyltransferase family 2 protein [Nocardioides montaniterrae]
MRFRRSAPPLISVVVPAYDTAAYLPACLDSLLAQTHTALEIVVVDDGSPDACGEIAASYAARDPRVKVLRQANGGLGAARNAGFAVTSGEVVAFADSDDVVPPSAYEVMVRQLQRTGADLVTGGVQTLVDGSLRSMPWMQRIHSDRAAVFLEQRPELLGDVFAWNKLYRRSFWTGAGLSWPERLRYEDQPTLTRAYTHARLIGVVPDVVYHWRIRSDGSSITQQRAALDDLRDRWTTKRMSLETVREFGSAKVSRVFTERVLPGDLWRYFLQIPTCSDDWWALLVAGVREFWGTHGSLTGSRLMPAHRLVGWMVEQDRRADASFVISYVVEHGGLPRVPDGGGRRVDVPGLDLTGIPRAALALRDDEK